MPRRARGCRGLSPLLAVCLACTTVGPARAPERTPSPRRARPLPPLQHARLDPGDLVLQPEGRTVQQNWILDIYTLLHSRDYRSFRIRFPGSDGDPATAHLLLPGGAGPHPLVVVFPILEGTHTVSEGLGKALVGRGYAVARLERRDLHLAEARDPETPARALRHALLDARRLLDGLLARDDLDARRVASAGVSIGGILALTLMEIDPRVRAGFFLLTGGEIAEILFDSSEKPVRVFRERLQRLHPLQTREAWLAFVQPHLEGVDPIPRADRIDPRQVLLVSGRFDRVVRPRHTRALWEALGRPTWTRVPCGHYQFFPFFWWAIGRGAGHLDRFFASEGLGAGEGARRTPPR